MGGRMESRRADNQLRQSECSKDGAHMIVVHDGDKPRYETILHTGTRSVWTVQDAKTPTRSGEIRIGCGND